MDHFKINEPNFLRARTPTLTRMRETGPLVAIKIPFIGKCWVTTTDAAARALLKDEVHFVRNPANAGGRDISRYYWFLPRFMGVLNRNILSLDGTEHARLRKAVDQHISRGAIDALQPEIKQIADDLLDRLDSTQPIDITKEYAQILPLDVISKLLGILPDQRTELARAIAPISEPTTTWNMLRAMPGLYKSLKLLRAEIETIRKTPRAGLLCELIHDAENNLTDDELVSLSFVLFVAGHETTLHLISDAIFGLTENTQHRAIFQSNDSATTFRAVEKYMRFFSPVMMTKPLFVRKDHVFHGQAVKQGEKILALLIAANHDPERFENAQIAELGRRPNAHIGFGFGPHVCLGMHLARAEAQIALDRLFQRYPDVQRAPQDAAPEYTQRFVMRGMRRLMVQLKP